MTAYKNDRKYLQTIYLMRDLYLVYVDNSVIKRLSLLKKKKTVEDLNMHFPKRMYK